VSGRQPFGDDAGDCTVKLRGSDANKLSDDWLRLDGIDAKREPDLIVDDQGGPVPSFSITVEITGIDIETVKDGKRLPMELFSDAQKRFVDQNVGHHTME
jgi:hypothetical protein